MCGCARSWPTNSGFRAACSVFLFVRESSVFFFGAVSGVNNSDWLVRVFLLVSFFCVVFRRTENEMDHHQYRQRLLHHQRRMPGFPCRVEGWLNICGELVVQVSESSKEKKTWILERIIIGTRRMTTSRADQSRSDQSRETR